MQSYHIFLDDPQEVYHAKDIISGHIHVEILKPLHFQNIQVRIHGRAKTRIQYGTQNDIKFAGCKRNIIDSVITANIAGACEITDENVLLPGIYNFTFAFQLPKAQLPSTFEGVSGNSVRYMIKSYISLPENIENKLKSKKIFLYHETLPPRQASPVPSEIMENETMLYCLCCKSGPLRLKAQIDRNAYKTGQDIKIISSQVDNYTNQTLSGICAEFVQIVNRKAEDRSYRDKVVYCFASSGEPIRPNDNATWNNHSITIPDVSPSNTMIDILNVKYYLKIQLIFMILIINNALWQRRNHSDFGYHLAIMKSGIGSILYLKIPTCNVQLQLLRS